LARRLPKPQPLIPPRTKQKGEHPPGQLGGGFLTVGGFLEEAHGGEGFAVDASRIL
jgi:hypothetical protein